MREIVPTPAPALADPAVLSDRTFRRFLRLRDRFAKRAGWLAAAGLVVPLVAFIFALEVADSCYDEDCGSPFLFGFGLVAAGGLLVFSVSLAFLTSNGARRQRLREYQLLFNQRLQGLKDWFLRGDITEADYAAFRERFERSSAGDAPDETATHASQFHSRLGAIAIVWMVPLSVIAFLFIVTLEDLITFALLVDTLLVWTMFLVTAIVSFRRSKGFAAEGEALAAEQSNALEAAEMELLKSARNRRGLRTEEAPRQTVGSFRPYPGR